MRSPPSVLPESDLAVHALLHAHRRVQLPFRGPHRHLTSPESTPRFGAISRRAPPYESPPGRTCPFDARRIGELTAPSRADPRPPRRNVAHLARKRSPRQIQREVPPAQPHAALLLETAATTHTLKVPACLHTVSASLLLGKALRSVTYPEAGA